MTMPQNSVKMVRTAHLSVEGFLQDAVILHYQKTIMF